MKCLLPSLLLVTVWSAAAQYIFIPFKGEREIMPTHETRASGMTGPKKCGAFFLYEEYKDQKIVRFQVPERAGDFPGTNHLTTIGIQLLIIELNDEKQAPTAEYILPLRVHEPPKILIRISKQDYHASACLKLAKTSQ